MTTQSNDWELFSAWRDGDERAAEDLINRYFGILTRFFINKVRDADNAADLVSETFLACTAQTKRAEERGAFRSYLFAIAMNKLRGYYRKQAKRRRELDDFAELCVAQSLPGTPTSIIAHKEEIKVLVRALRRLTLAQQIVVELHVFEGLRGPAISELLEIPASTVYTHLRRGKQRLATLVAEIAHNPELAETTMNGLETWAHDIRAQIARG